MDYVCELPNDSARRKALSALPPTLNATYERILRRVNASNKNVQTLVSRVLRWIIHQKSSWHMKLSTAALCEAVSIEIGDSRRDLDSISDEIDILKWCSSLVRKSADGDTLELAHFTVKEFLQQLQDEDTGEFAAYRLRPAQNETELAKVCLTYLGFQDFNQAGYLSPTVGSTRLKEYPLRRYAVLYWFDHARGHLDDAELFRLVTRLLSPSKPNNLISWAQDYLEDSQDFLGDSDVTVPPLTLTKVNIAVAESTALHFAAMLALPEVCTWLIERGCDVNRSTLLGTPLHCGLLRGPTIFSAFSEKYHYSQSPQGQSIISVLLDAGADPNSPFSVSTGTWSPIAVSLYSGDSVSAIRILEKGGRLDELCFIFLEDNINKLKAYGWKADKLRILLTYFSSEDLEAHPRIIGELGLRCGWDVNAVNGKGLDCQMLAQNCDHGDPAKKVICYEEQQGMLYRTEPTYVLADYMVC